MPGRRDAALRGRIPGRTALKRLPAAGLSALTALASLAMVLLLLEGIVRLTGSGEGKPDGRPESRPPPKADSFREELPQGRKAENEFRILAFGDSYTWGAGILDGRRVWPKMLEKNLRREGGTRPFKVVNLGVPGFTTVNELELFTKVGRNLEPDLVLVQYLINDVLPSSDNYRRLGERWLQRRETVHLAPRDGAHRFLERRSRLYVFVNYRFEALQRRIWPPRKWEELYREDFAGWRDCRRAIRGFRLLAAEMGIPVVLVTFPLFIDGKWTEDDYPYRDIYAKVGRAAGEEGIEVLDLLPFFAGEGRDFEDWHVHATDAHPGVDAHALAAEAVARFLRQSALVPQK